MVLSTAHGASTLFAAEWNDMVYALNHADSTVDHQAYSSNTNWNVTSSAHGLCPSFPQLSSQFLSGTGGWSALTSDDINVVSSAAQGLMTALTGTSTVFFNGHNEWATLENEMWKKYTTGNATTMFSDLSTYVGSLATVTSWAYPLYSIHIPPFVQQSKVDISVGVASCSSATANTYALLFMQAAQRPGSNQPIDPKTTVTLSTKVQGVLFAVFPTTSAWATFTTQITVVGGETYTFYALSTTAPIIKIRNLLITGATAAAQYPTDAWTTSIGTTYG
jgi:hypothetical protein